MNKLLTGDAIVQEMQRIMASKEHQELFARNEQNVKNAFASTNETSEISKFATAIRQLSDISYVFDSMGLEQSSFLVLAAAGKATEENKKKGKKSPAKSTKKTKSKKSVNDARSKLKSSKNKKSKCNSEDEDCE
jgi:hypothetical protein